MYASRVRCDSPARSTFATTGVPSESSALYTSPIQPPPSGRAQRRRSPKAASTPSAMSPSATMVLQVPPPDVLQEPLRRLFHEIHDQLEALRPAVVRVRDLRLWPSRGIVHKEPHLGYAASAERLH